MFVAGKCSIFYTIRSVDFQRIQKVEKSNEWNSRFRLTRKDRSRSPLCSAVTIDKKKKKKKKKLQERRREFVSRVTKIGLRAVSVLRFISRYDN